MSAPAARRVSLVEFRTFKEARDRFVTASRPHGSAPAGRPRVLSDREIEHRKAMLANLARPKTIRVPSGSGR